MKRLLLCCLVFLMSMSFAHAYYADVIIEVDNAGVISIEGTTNHPSLIVQDSSDFTSKNGKYWLLNVSVNGSFSDVAYEIHLPDGSKINYMKLPNFGRIQQTNGIVISGASSNTLFSVVVQYEIENTASEFPIWIVIILALIVLGSMYIYRTIKEEKKPQKKLDLSIYSPRQAKILELLQRHKGSLSQVKLEALTGYPKSSLSRNIQSLVRKDVIEKFNNGMSNKIRIKK